MTALKPSEVLSKAADLIEPKGAWTQGSFGRTARGDLVHYAHANPVCFCARGALGMASEARGLSDGFPPAELYLHLAITGKKTERREQAGAEVVSFNDDPKRTQPEVVAALRKAADLAKAEGQ